MCKTKSGNTKIMGTEKRGRNERAIDDPTSLEIERYIRIREACIVTEIAEDLSYSRQTIDRYIKILSAHKRIRATPNLGDMRKCIWRPNS